MAISNIVMRSSAGVGFSDLAVNGSVIVTRLPRATVLPTTGNDGDVTFSGAPTFWYGSKWNYMASDSDIAGLAISLASLSLQLGNLQTQVTALQNPYTIFAYVPSNYTLVVNVDSFVTNFTTLYSRGITQSAGVFTVTHTGVYNVMVQVTTTGYVPYIGSGVMTMYTYLQVNGVLGPKKVTSTQGRGAVGTDWSVPISIQCTFNAGDVFSVRTLFSPAVNRGNISIAGSDPSGTGYVTYVSVTKVCDIVTTLDVDAESIADTGEHVEGSECEDLSREHEYSHIDDGFEIEDRAEDEE